MYVDATTKAAKEFLSTLPAEMVVLALEAVELQEQLDSTTEKSDRDVIQRELKLIKQRIILSGTKCL